MSDLVSFKNPVFSSYAFYSGIVLCKTLGMALLTTHSRFRYNTFVNPEDLGPMFKKPDSDIRIPPQNSSVERIRRCHLNDLENVLPFVLVGFLYVCTKPDPTTALVHFRLFAGVRIFHTFAYLLPLPQPARAWSFLAGWLTTLSMAYSVMRAGSWQ